MKTKFFLGLLAVGVAIAAYAGMTTGPALQPDNVTITSSGSSLTVIPQPTNTALITGTTNNPFAINTLWTNGSIQGFNGRASGYVTFAITPSATVASVVAVIVKLNNGTTYTVGPRTNDPITGVTAVESEVLNIPLCDSNSVINPTNESSAGPTVKVGSSFMIAN
jgi:TRAP-type uncharacterized transport system substrate-binding protein